MITAIGFLASSVGTALAPNLAAFFVFRILTALEGTSFLLVGSAIIGYAARSMLSSFSYASSFSPRRGLI